MWKNMVINSTEYATKWKRSKVMGAQKNVLKNENQKKKVAIV